MVLPIEQQLKVFQYINTWNRQ